MQNVARFSSESKENSFRKRERGKCGTSFSRRPPVKVHQDVGKPGELVHRLPLFVGCVATEAPNDQVAVAMSQLRKNYRHQTPTERLKH